MNIIQIKQPNNSTMQLKLVGTGSLLMNRMSDDELQSIIDKDKSKKIDHKKRWKDKCHEEKGQYGFPAIAFKKSAIRAAKVNTTIAMTDARQMFQVIPDEGDLVFIDSEPPVMRQDRVKGAGNTAAVSFRPQFKKWSCVLTIQYNADVVNPESIASLFAHAGNSVGVGSWRIETDGVFGGFYVASIAQDESKVA